MNPLVYISDSHGILTTGGWSPEQLMPEILELENETEVSIISQVDCWTVHVSGRFAPIGRVYALAMLRPSKEVTAAILEVL